jgi:hypothetical protein
MTLFLKMLDLATQTTGHVDENIFFPNMIDELH